MPAPTPANLIDASDDVIHSLRLWAVFVDPDFDRIVSNADDMRHPAEAVPLVIRPTVMVSAGPGRLSMSGIDTVSNA